jgi:hypothetical protein
VQFDKLRTPETLRSHRSGFLLNFIGLLPKMTSAADIDQTSIHCIRATDPSRRYNMAIIRSLNVRWDKVIPYLGPVPAVFERALQLFGDQASHPRWVPVEESEKGQYAAWVVFNMNSTVSCSAIGCQRKGQQEVCLKPDGGVASALHEMMHCAGFEHEQFHPGYVWDRQDTPNLQAIKEAEEKQQSRARARFAAQESTVDWTARKTSYKSNLGAEDPLGKKKAKEPEVKFDPEFMKMLAAKGKKPPAPKEVPPPQPTTPVEPDSRIYKALKTRRNQLIFQSILKDQSETYMISFLEQLVIKENLHPVSAFCDYDSIMMYGEFLRAAQFVQKELPSLGIDTAGAGTVKWDARERLSLGDIEALKTLYQ